MTERNEITNKYNIGEVIIAKNLIGLYKIVKIELDKEGIIWYNAYNINNKNYSSLHVIKEENIERSERENELHRKTNF